MESWILTAVILAIILWCVVRTGPRRAERSLRMLAQRAQGRYWRGGWIHPSRALLPHSGGDLQVTLRCMSWFGGSYVGALRAPWPAGRRDVAWAEPTRLLIPGGPNSRGSDQLREAARRLQASPKVGQVWVEAKGGKFISQAMLTTAEIGAVTAWVEASVRLHDLMVAETEAGIRFSPATTASGAASCQVCGVAPEPEETVYCERCGAPHHADCWKYNRGCAIYGCKKRKG